MSRIQHYFKSHRKNYQKQGGWVLFDTELELDTQHSSRFSHTDKTIKNRGGGFYGY